MSSALELVTQTAGQHRQARQAARQCADAYAEAVRLALETEPARLVAVAAGVTVDGVYKLVARRWPKTKEIAEDQGPALDDDQPAPLTD